MTDAKSCKKCGEGTTKDYVQVGDDQYHTSCFKCDTCSMELGGKPYIAADNCFFCEKDYYKKYSKPCGHCEEIIEGQYVEAMGKAWHEDHFVCTECAQPFPDGQFHKHEDRPYCKEHYLKLVAETCGKCGKDITGELFEALDQKFHKECFTCGEGNHEIKEGERFHEYEGTVYCSDHLGKLLELDCSVCGKLITGEYIKVLDKKMHKACWTCEQDGCSTVLDASNVKQSNGKFFCSTHGGGVNVKNAGGASGGAGGDAAPAKQMADLKVTEEKKDAGAAPATPAGPALPEGVTVFYSYESLKDKANLPPGVDIRHREQFLADDVFKSLFGVDKAGFAKLARWKQKQKKQRLGLF